MTPFRLAYVPGVTPSKWARVWVERKPEHPLDLVRTEAGAAEPAVRDGEVDAALLRLPVDREVLHAIPLYTEVTVAVLPKDHFLAAADELSLADIADELVLHPHDDTLDWPHPPGKPVEHRPDTVADAVELVAAGLGLLLVPQSLARLHHRRDLTYRPVEGVPQSQVALSWPRSTESDDIEDLIGIVRGRTENSSRGRQTRPDAKPDRKRERTPPPPAKRPKPKRR
ncbi:LysR substrate-binding domain-containing protein [Actinokineospora pegani]|uniref:LysR substrate-binding domain-containing protein n=1 Tax=Actinokineospora pegani TaxID=2654637 RepID=UPI0012EA78D2|nr:LysR substrate-binding domain-containing protein [Actinokineospora pegani]